MADETKQLEIIHVRDTGREYMDNKIFDIIFKGDLDGDIQTMSERASKAAEEQVGKGTVPVVVEYQREFQGRKQYKLKGVGDWTFGQGGQQGGRRDGGGGWSPERTAQVQRGNALNAAAAALSGHPKITVEEVLGVAEILLAWLRAEDKPNPQPEIETVSVEDTSTNGSTPEWDQLRADFKELVEVWQQINPGSSNQEVQRAVLYPVCEKHGWAYPVSPEMAPDVLAQLVTIVRQTKADLLAANEPVKEDAPAL